MKRSARAAVRDSARRSLRLQLIQHDVPSLALAASSPTPTTVASSASHQGLSEDAIAKLIDERIATKVQELTDAAVQKHLQALQEHARQDAALRTSDAVQPTVEQTIATTHAKAAQYQLRESADVTEPYSAQDADESVSPAAHHAADARPAAASHATNEPAAASTSGVRVVTRKSISGDAARHEAAPSLARVAHVDREQSGLAPRCIAHAGQHYRGATEDEVTEAWNAMRERFHLSPENKIVARRALLKWLQQSKNVCASNVHWYGDFVAIRSCNVRVAKSHPAFGVDGWFILFDPNGDAVMREPLFSEAFETPNKRYAGAVPRLGRPAWLSEERRAAAAARHGGADLRPFSPETADDLSSQDFFRGRAE